MPATQSQRKILIAPLDWGLGHATRCIPLVRECLHLDHEVIIGTSGRSLKLLQDEFPDLKFVEIPSYNIYYQKSGSFILKIIGQLNKVFRGINHEKKITAQIIKDHAVDLIISDNRYGVHNNHVYSVIITHQLMVKIPGQKLLESAVRQWLKWKHHKFREVWIPDAAGDINISGDLSHKYKIDRVTKFIGVLTRFEEPKIVPEIKYDVLAILSGPEPQRTIFEALIIHQAENSNLRFVIVSGTSEKKSDENISKNIRLISYLKAGELYDLTLSSSIIISRGGYSTLMDLALLGKRCIFIPTPGQTEQEYIVDELAKKKMVYTVDQKDFNLQTAIESVNKLQPFKIPVDRNEFKNHLRKLIEQTDAHK